ncbi:disease resistance protein (CC-NBS-LRR class) family protein [Medicago truncatula]|uniref:Disease resistance protein (CC-NBS-LRR class) family protein n=1 Tax=Medicago truncatula TaxID=3880 RepID=G7LGB8_MEDTR|nr:disease resistance protein (CC-NBS-LRR class) family protein [Medicago truncatula]
MAGELVGGAFLGAVVQEGAKPFTNQISKGLKFKKTRKIVDSLVERIKPAAEEIERLNENLDRPKEETKVLMEELKQGKEVVNKHSKVPWWKFCCLPCFQGELQAKEEKIARTCSLVTPMNTARDVKETLSIVRDLKGRQFNFKRLCECDPPVKPDFTVGLDVPLHQLKNWVLSSDVSVDSVHVLTGLAGSGKTTLATLLCCDDKVIGKFGENILFFHVAKNPDLKNIVQTLFEHCGHKKPYLVDHDDAVKNLRCLLNKIGENRRPLMLVLDNVFQGSESFVNAFKVQVPDYKILITSRPLSDDDAVTVFRHFALPNDGTTGSYVPDEDDVQQIAKGCWGSPLALESIGGSLNGQHIEAWKEMVNMLSEGGSIVDSNDELRDRLQKVLENALQDNHIVKECFMDLGLFFEDKKIPVAALIDMWTELYDLDDDNIKGMNIVRKLANWHLVKLVVSREVTTHVDHYYNHHFLTQHDLLKEISIHQARQEPFELRKRLIFDVNENSWDQQNQQNTIARTLSISPDKILTSDWSNVEKIKQVEVLILNLHTEKYTLPECIKKMTKLKVLIITNYKGFHCAELDNFEILGCLPNLRRIRLHQVSVPSLCKLVNLRKLSLYFCETKQAFQSNTVSISDILPNLKELCVDYCKDLVTLPSGLCDITSLKKLSITRCINFLSLPQEIGNLENLKVLRLSSCAELEEIPTSIEKLLKLHFLDISGCASFHSLPEEIGNLHNLKELHMTGFSLDTLPGSVTKLKNLKHLICDQETAVCWENFKPSLPNLKIEEAEVNLFIIV